MSELALTYYAALAKSHDIAVTDMPSILDGMPVPLLDPEQEVPVRNPNAALVHMVEEEYKSTIRSLSSFLIKCTYPEVEPVPANPPLARGTTRHIGGIVPVLLRPHNRSTGYRSGLQIQAIAPEEVGEYSLRTSLKMRDGDPVEFTRMVAQSVLLLVSADVYPRPKSREPDYIGFVGIVRAVQGPAIAATGRQLGMLELNTNQERWKPAVSSGA